MLLFRKPTARAFLFILWIILVHSSSSRAQTKAQEATVQITGEVKITITLSLTAMDALEKSTVLAPDRTNKAHTYTGVLLATLLKNAGVTLGDELKGENLKKYLLLEARDGYQVLFSLAETDPVFSEKKIILANRMDGVALSPDQGPFQIIVEGEKRKARFIRQVTRISVQSAL